MGLKFLVVLVIAVTLAGCSSSTSEPPTATYVRPQPTVNVQPTIFAAQTQAVQTYIANQTLNAPTATKVLPTNTLAPTVPQPATATPQKATATLTPKPAGPTITPSIFCTVKSVYPSTANTISPGSAFTAIFVIANTGSATWTTSYTYNFWSGARFENQRSQNLPFSVVVNSDITLAIDLKASSTPGTYKAVWAVLNGFQPVCLMALNVVVK